ARTRTREQGNKTHPPPAVSPWQLRPSHDPRAGPRQWRSTTPLAAAACSDAGRPPRAGSPPGGGPPALGGTQPPPPGGGVGLAQPRAALSGRFRLAAAAPPAWRQHGFPRQPTFAEPLPPARPGLRHVLPSRPLTRP